MFQNAVRIVRSQVSPIVVARRTASGKASCRVIGAALVINPDGWFITVDHVLASLEKNAREVTESLEDQGRPDRVTHLASAVGFTGARIRDAYRFPENDLAIGKLAGYTAPEGHVFPVIPLRDPEPGAVLCRIGFPFSGPIPIRWTQPGGFRFATSQTEVPPFLNQAMVSRIVPGNPSWIETSGAGLPGHSGGPLVDSEGRVCGIDSGTRHIPRKLEGNETYIMTVGRVIPVRKITGHLDTLGVQYRSGGV